MSKELKPPVTGSESDLITTAADVMAVVTSAFPVIGGPVSAILGGIGTSRKLKRVKEVMECLGERLQGVESDVRENYVRTEDFQELLENALRAIGDEQNEDKRRVYASFIAQDMLTAIGTYDDKARALRFLKSLEIDHLKVLWALALEPDRRARVPPMGSAFGTLRERLPGLVGQINDLIGDLNRMGLTSIANLHIMTTGMGSMDLRNSLTRDGHIVVRYVGEPA
jgi:hypothetical protein